MPSARLILVGGASALALVGAGFASAAAPKAAHAPSSTLTRAAAISQLHTLETRAAGNARVLAGLRRAELALRTSAPAAQAHGKPSPPPPSCPPSSPNGGGSQPCGNGGGKGGNPPPCPPNSPNGGGTQPCGSPSPSPSSSSGGGGTPPCGVDNPPTGPISGPLFGIGEQINGGGGAPLGDLVEQISCAVYTNLTL